MTTTSDREDKQNAWAIGLLGFLVFVLLISFTIVNAQLTQAQKTLAAYEKNYVYEAGFVQGYGNYKVFTPDGGRDWYNVQNGSGDEREMIILGPADPALIKQITALDALIDNAEKNGPIGSHPVTTEEKQILSNAGLSVTATP